MLRRVLRCNACDLKSARSWRIHWDWPSHLNDPERRITANGVVDLNKSRTRDNRLLRLLDSTLWGLLMWALALRGGLLHVELLIFIYLNYAVDSSCLWTNIDTANPVNYYWCREGFVNTIRLARIFHEIDTRWSDPLCHQEILNAK